MDEQALTLLLAQGLSVERIAKRYGKHPSTVSYWMEQYGLTAVNRDRHAAKGGIDRDRLVALVEDGESVGQIAIAVGRSKGTVRHWMRVFGLRTVRAREAHTDQAIAAKDAGLLTVRMRCRHHGDAEFILEGRGYYRCKRCRSDGVVRHRQKVKAILVEEAGGRCCLCGYDRCLAALEFHHLDPSQKRLALSGQGVTYSLATLRAEASKCALVCANCHAELENGAASLPARVLPRRE
jgi:transposase-like protein